MDATERAAARAGLGVNEYVDRLDRGYLFCYRCQGFHLAEEFGSDTSRVGGKPGHACSRCGKHADHQRPPGAASKALTAQTANQEDSMTRMSGPLAGKIHGPAIAGARRAVQAAASRLAEDSGAEIREIPRWRGAALTDKKAEPLAGIAAARILEQLTAAVTFDYIGAARGDGIEWAAIGKALGLGGDETSPDELAAAAYIHVVGVSDVTHPARFSFTCSDCDGIVSDYGPGHANPEDAERGHVGDYPRVPGGEAAPLLS